MRASFGRIRFAAPLLVLSVISRSVLAAPPQPPATPANDVASADAKRHFEAGVKLYAERVYASALAEFEESYRLGGKAVALKNVAQCHRDLKHFAEALDRYRQLLTLHGGDLKPKDKADVERSVEELAKVVGTLEILAEPPGAEVSIDGKVVGLTPIKPVHVDVGSHEIKISKAGYQPFTKSLTLVAEQRAAVSTALVPEVTTGHVVVSEPGGLVVKVLVDDKDVGSAPWEGDLAPGTHTIQLVGEGLASEKRSVDVQVKGRVEISLGAQATTGKIDVRVVPANGELFLDAKPLGRGSYAGPVEPGQHTLEASAPGFHAQRTTITIERGKVFPIVVTLIEDRPALPGEGKKRRRTDDDADFGRDTYRGTYGRLSLTFPYPLAGGVGPTAMAPDVTDDPSTSARGDFFSGGAGMRVGYNFDPFGLEFVSNFTFTKYTNALDWQRLGKTETMSFQTMGGFAGLGARVTSREETVRVSAGFAIGAVFRWTKLSDSWTRADSVTLTSERSTNDVNDVRIKPALGFDAELMIGSTPGTRFLFGVESWVEFLGTTTVSFDPRQLGSASLPTGPYTLSGATAFYVGPHLGLQFGR